MKTFKGYVNDKLITLSEECVLSVEGGACALVIPSTSGMICLGPVDYNIGLFCPNGIGFFCDSKN